MDYDVLVVGGGPAGISHFQLTCLLGLATAIKLKELANEKNQDLNVCLIEKGPKIGAHILSGNVFIPDGLTELFPNWKEEGVSFVIGLDLTLIGTFNYSSD